MSRTLAGRRRPGRLTGWTSERTRSWSSWPSCGTGRFEALHREAMAIGGPIGRLLARQVRRVESELAEQRARITERILGRRR